LTIFATVVERRSSEVLSTQLNDDGPVYYALSVHLSQAKLIARSTIHYYSAPIRERSIAMIVSVCLRVFVCPRSYLRTSCTSDLNQIFVLVTHGRASVLLWRRSDTLCTSGFMDGVVFAHMPRLLDVADQLKRSAHAALGLAIKFTQ